jgi:hypothetical protein
MLLWFAVLGMLDQPGYPRVALCSSASHAVTGYLQSAQVLATRIDVGLRFTLVETVLHRPTREAAYAATRSPDRLATLGQTRSSFAKYS